MDGWTIGADIATMLTGISVLTAAAVWLSKQARDWWTTRGRRSQILPGQSLLPGQALWSPDGRTRFVLQTDANMIVSVEGYGVITDTNTTGDGSPGRLTLEKGSGWLILYATDGTELWKQGPGGARLEVQDNGHVVLYPALGKAIWATDYFLTRGHVVRAPGGSATPPLKH